MSMREIKKKPEEDSNGYTAKRYPKWQESYVKK